MDQRTNGVAGEPVPSVREFLTGLAAEVDQQIVHVLGGEFLDGSGFEQEVPEANFGREGESNG